MMQFSDDDGVTQGTMEHNFLLTVYAAILDITHAERAMAADEDLRILQMLKIKESDLQEARFGAVVQDALRRAMHERAPMVTNNIITDPSEAPDTNTNFADLRVIVALPVAGYGVVYLDQHIRYGMIPHGTVDRIMRLIEQVLPVPHDHLTAEDLIRLYQQMI